MRSLTKPTTSARVVFLTCISNITKDLDLKTRLQAIADHIESTSKTYEMLAQLADYATMIASDTIPTTDGAFVTAKEMGEKVYRDKMSKRGQPGRKYYDQIILAAKSICPLCGHRVVTTLDHYLAKSKFPALAVTPSNLIPSCSDCNWVKLKEIDKGSDSGITIHPYFERVDAHQWIFATVAESKPPAVIFSPKPPDDWPPRLRSRAETHFNKFGLSSLYTTYAGGELANIRHRLEELHRTVGSDGIVAHLNSEAASRKACNPNSWQHATYQALSGSTWFCEEGFRFI